MAPDVKSISCKSSPYSFDIHFLRPNSDEKSMVIFKNNVIIGATVLKKVDLVHYNFHTKYLEFHQWIFSQSPDATFRSTVDVTLPSAKPLKSGIYEGASANIVFDDEVDSFSENSVPCEVEVN